MNKYNLAPPTDAVQLSRLQAIRLSLSATIQETRRSTDRKLRSPSASLMEYEQRWAKQIAQKRWQYADNLAMALQMSSYGDVNLNALMESISYTVPARSFFRWRAEKIAKIFKYWYPLNTPITEIGCGLGKNLLVLAWAGYKKLTGLEPVRSALSAISDQCQYFNVDIGVHHFNLLSPDPVVLDRISGHVLFTNYVMEQLPYDIPNALESLIRTNPQEVIHIEPCIEFLKPFRNIVDLPSYFHIKRCDYQQTLIQELERLHQNAVIQILEITPLGFSPVLRNAPTLIRWRPKKLASSL